MDDDTRDEDDRFDDEGEPTQTLSERERLRNMFEEQSGLAPRPFLVGQSPRHREARYLLTDADTSIGRSGECSIVLNDPSVSARHAVIRRDETGLRVLDSDSTNGTFVNDRRIKDSPLSTGDTIRFGESVFKLVLPK